MPVAYQFIDRKTNKPVSLSEIDEQMCKDLEIPCHPKHFCSLYTYCELLGSISRIQNKEGAVDKDKLLAYLAEKPESELGQKERKLVVKYLSEDYKFCAWYESKGMR